MSERSSETAIRVGFDYFIRGVEQTSVMAAAITGQGTGNHAYNQIAASSANAMLGFLASTAFLDTQVVHLDVRDRSAARDLAKQYPDLFKVCKGSGGASTESLDVLPGVTAQVEGRLHLCISPTDGKTAAADGLEGGSISAIAASEENGLVDPYEGRFDHLYVVCARREIVENSGFAETLALAVKKRWTPGEGVFDWTSSLKIKNLYKQVVQKVGALPTVALLSADDHTAWRDAGFRVRRLNGSSVAAGLLTALQSSETHVFAGCVRRSHAVMLSVAMRATGGALWAAPLVRPPTKARSELRKKKYLLAENPGAVKTAEDFAPGENSFLLVAGISDQPAVRGVRFKKDQRVSVQTIAFAKAGEMRRTTGREFNLVDHKFHCFDGKQNGGAAWISAASAIKEFRKTFLDSDGDEDDAGQPPEKSANTAERTGSSPSGSEEVVVKATEQDIAKKK